MPCSICNQSGHNRRTCPVPRKPLVNNLLTAPITVSTEAGVSSRKKVPMMDLNLNQLSKGNLEAEKSDFLLNRKEQWDLAQKCVEDLIVGKNISIKAEEKSGKRGIMECIHVILRLKYLEDDPFVSNDSPKSIYVTALNRKDTKVQLIEQEGFGITSCILSKASKSSELLGKIVEIMGDEMNNSTLYIHLDECDYGTGDKQSLSKLYNHSAISTWKHRIKFITYSATPEELVKSEKVEVPDWSFHTFIPADTYFGAQKYLDNGLIYHPEEFFDDTSITSHGKEILDEIKIKCPTESQGPLHPRNIIIVRAKAGQLDLIRINKRKLEEDNGCDIHIYDQNNGFQWGEPTEWNKLGKKMNKDEYGDPLNYEYKPVIIFICGTCTRSTEIDKLGHKRIYAWHDNRRMSEKKCYNTLSQAIGRVKHYTNGEENTIKLYCDINIINTTLGIPTIGLEEKDKKLSLRIKCVKTSSSSHKYKDGYEDINSVPDINWKEDSTIPIDGETKKLNSGAVYHAKGGKWHQQNGTNPRLLLFNDSAGNIPGSDGLRSVIQYKSKNSNKYIERKYSMDVNCKNKYTQKTTGKSMYS